MIFEEEEFLFIWSLYVRKIQYLRKLNMQAILLVKEIHWLFLLGCRIIFLHNLFYTSTTLNIRSFAVTMTIFTYILCNLFPTISITSLFIIAQMSKIPGISSLLEINNDLLLIAIRHQFYFLYFSLKQLHSLVSSSLLVLFEFAQFLSFVHSTINNRGNTLIQNQVVSVVVQ